LEKEVQFRDIAWLWRYRIEIHCQFKILLNDYRIHSFQPQGIYLFCLLIPKSPRMFVKRGVALVMEEAFPQWLLHANISYTNCSIYSFLLTKHR
jgi:hypothetical protein